MGYFTETINALYETKGEIAADHSTERTGIKTSGDHQIGKYIRDNKATLRKESDHYNLGRKPMRTAKDYRDREAGAKSDIAVNKELDKMSGKDFRRAARVGLGSEKEAFDFSSVSV